MQDTINDALGAEGDPARRAIIEQLAVEAVDLGLDREAVLCLARQVVERD